MVRIIRPSFLGYKKNRIIFFYAKNLYKYEQIEPKKRFRPEPTVREPPEGLEPSTC